MVKKSIAICVNSLGGGGSEKVVSMIINSLYQEFEIHLILLTDLIEYSIPKDDIHIHQLTNEPLLSKNRVKDVLRIPFLAHKLKKYLEANNIKLSFSFMFRSNYINSYLKILKWEGTVLISERAHTLSNYPYHTLAGWTGRFLVKNLYPYADRILPNSKAMAEQLREIFLLGNPMQVIHNPLEIEKIQEQIKEDVSDIQFDRFTFVTVGRLEPEKNQSLLLDAFALLNEPNSQLLIIGKGGMEKFLKKKVETLQIQNKVKFIQFSTNPHKYTARADCFVMSSLNEGFPNGLLESLACGTPVISVDCQTGPRELLSEYHNYQNPIKEIELAKFGILTPVKDAAKLAGAMKIMMKDFALWKAYKDKSCSRVMEFDTSIVMNEYRKLFNDHLH